MFTAKVHALIARRFRYHLVEWISWDTLTLQSLQGQLFKLLQGYGLNWRGLVQLKPRGVLGLNK